MWLSQIAALHQTLSIGQKNQIQLDQIGTKGLSGLIDLVPAKRDLIACGRRRGHDPNTVFRRQPYHVSESRFALEHVGASRHKIGSKICIGQFWLSNIALIGKPLSKLRFQPQIGVTRLIHLNFSRPQFCASLHEGPVRRDRATHKFLHAVLELEVRDLLLQARNHNGRGIGIASQSCQQRLSVAKRCRRQVAIEKSCDGRIIQRVCIAQVNSPAQCVQVTQRDARIIAGCLTADDGAAQRIQSRKLSMSKGTVRGEDRIKDRLRLIDGRHGNGSIVNRLTRGNGRDPGEHANDFGMLQRQSDGFIQSHQPLSLVCFGGCNRHRRGALAAMENGMPLSFMPANSPLVILQQLCACN